MNKCGFTKHHSAHFLLECSAPIDLFCLHQSVAIAKLCLLQKNLASKMYYVRMKINLMIVEQMNNTPPIGGREVFFTRQAKQNKPHFKL